MWTKSVYCLPPQTFQFDFSWWDKWKNRRSEHFQTIFAKSAGFDYCNMRKIPTWRRCNKKVDIRIAAKDTNFDLFYQVNNILMSKSLGQLFNFLKTYSTCFCASPATAPPRSFGRLAFFTIILTPLDCLSSKFLFVFYSHWPNIFHSLLSNSVHLR